jgi:hypothetical protein
MEEEKDTCKPALTLGPDEITVAHALIDFVV